MEFQLNVTIKSFCLLTKIQILITCMKGTFQSLAFLLILNEYDDIIESSIALFLISFIYSCKYIFICFDFIYENKLYITHNIIYILFIFTMVFFVFSFSFLLLSIFFIILCDYNDTPNLYMFLFYGIYELFNIFSTSYMSCIDTICLFLLSIICYCLKLNPKTENNYNDIIYYQFKKPIDL